MAVNKPERKLEGYKIFPYVAWGLIILFVFFVFKLTTTLTTTATELDEEASALEDRANASTKDLKKMDFEQ